MQEITLVTAFFDIGRGNIENPDLRRSNEDYFSFFRFWARIRNYLVIYTEPAHSGQIMEIRNEFGLGDKTKIIEVENIFGEFPILYDRMKAVSDNQDFRSFRFYEKAISNSVDYDYIMLMKYWCMMKTAEDSICTPLIAWIDFGFNHGGEKFINPEEFDFLWKWTCNDRVQLYSLSDTKKVFSMGSLQLQFDTIMGPIIIAPTHKCSELWNLVYKAMEALLMLDCIDDDQQLLLMAVREKPELFDINQSEWFLPLKECGGEHLTIKMNGEYVIKKRKSRKNYWRNRKKTNRERYMERMNHYVERYYE